MTKLYNNLADPIYINIYPNKDAVDIEDKELFRPNPNTIFVESGSEIILRRDEEESILYISSYDSQKNVERMNIFDANLNTNDKIMVGERIFSEIKFHDTRKYYTYKPDKLFGMSYIIPTRIVYTYNITYLLIILFIVAVCSALFLLITINY